MICLMFEANPRGYLRVGSAPMSMRQLGRASGIGEARATKLTEELEAACVFSRDESGTIYSRRMVRDDELRAVRADAGSKGGSKKAANALANGVAKSGSSSSASASAAATAELSAWEWKAPDLPDPVRAWANHHASKASKQTARGHVERFTAAVGVDAEWVDKMFGLAPEDVVARCCASACYEVALMREAKRPGAIAAKRWREKILACRVSAS